jgi:hypothetical protein
MAATDLLDLWEELIHRAVQDKLAHLSQWNKIFRPNLGSVQDTAP